MIHLFKGYQIDSVLSNPEVIQDALEEGWCYNEIAYKEAQDQSIL
jgi:hypothetical protein